MIFSKAMLAGVAAGLLLFISAPALASAPQDAPKDVKYILGFYYGNGENILIREKNGALELLYRTQAKDNSFAQANVFPLIKERFDSYTMIEAGPMSSMTAPVKFERDEDGYGITCKVGGNRYSRYFFGVNEGEKGKPFRLPEVKDWDALRKAASEAVMPQVLAAGKTAGLTDLRKLPGLKFDLRYATAGNCFNAPLYSQPKAYLGEEAAAALAKVQQRLAAKGYGLLVWDAYRPWSVSYLASSALPQDKKFMLDDPLAKGSAHNTGNAIDVSLYDLTSGVYLDLGCDFDEPSFRQYASYPGGTSRQRYLRRLLRETMEEYGFSGIEMEWWHFEFDQKNKYAHLNIPFEQLQ